MRWKRRHDIQYRRTSRLEKSSRRRTIGASATDETFDRSDNSGTSGADFENELEDFAMDSPLLPRGSSEDFAIIDRYELPNEPFNLHNISNKDIARLGLSPHNVSLPVALMISNPQKFPTFSRSRKFCRNGRILIHRGPLAIDEATGNRTVFLPEQSCMGKVGDRVYPGDVIGRQVNIGSGYYRIQPRKQPPFDLPVVYEDNHFAIVNKPAGVVVYNPKHPEQGSLTVKAALPFALQPPVSGTINALKRPKSVHRLDKPTSGLLLVGKTLSAMDHLSRQFQERTIKKTYTAIINGIPEEDHSVSASFAHSMGCDVDPTSDDKWQFIDSPLDGKSAVTFWRATRYVECPKARDGYLTVVEVKLKTGRYHQIRRHMAWVVNRAIVGDKEYDGGTENARQLRGRGLFLCSNKVSLVHPFYNTRAGREVWHNLHPDEKYCDGKLFLHDDSVMVSCSIDLPSKFEGFLNNAAKLHQMSLEAGEMDASMNSNQ